MSWFRSLLSLVFLVLSFPAVSQVDMTQVPSSRSVEDAHAYFNDRLNLFIKYNLKRPMGAYQEGSFYETALARILANERTDEINDVILDPKTIAYAEVGTDFDGVIGLCKRNGDYDFKLTELIPLTYEAKKRGQLSTEAYNKILSQLLTVYGNRHQTRVWIGKCLNVRETENHILMIESARYLTNQLWNDHYPQDPRFDNEKNGFNDWFLRHLQQFLRQDFEEFNSRPYQGHSIKPLLNLVSYARDERVRLAATMVLDYLSAKFAVQSSQLRRSAPICRQHEYAVRTNLFTGDHMTSIFAMLAGNNDIFRHNDPAGTMTYGIQPAMNAGKSAYRAHNLILDMIIRNDQELELRVRHDAVESYYKHPKFLLTAGGRYLNRFDGGMGKRDAWAYPTSLMANRGHEVDRTQLLRFEGADNEKKRNNMCHYKNFACGMNFQLPKDLPAGCLMDKGEWKFVNYQTESCPHKFGYYVAVRVRPYPKTGLFKKRPAQNFGVFEAVDADEVGFDEFMEKTLRNNQRPMTHKKGNLYTTFDGTTIEFTPGTLSLKKSPITAVNGSAPFPERFCDWPFLSGNVLTGKGDGRIMINNPKLGKGMILDYRNSLMPEKRILNTGL